MDELLNKMEQWIDQTNKAYASQRICCLRFAEVFNGFYSVPFLEESYFVVVDNIPKPDFAEIQLLGLDGFINQSTAGITYKDTYYILSPYLDELRLHFHELVHIAQWRYLGTTPFMKRYISEIINVGYDDVPLEKMAYAFDSHYSQNGEKIDVVKVVDYLLAQALE